MLLAHTQLFDLTVIEKDYELHLIIAPSTLHTLLSPAHHLLGSSRIQG